MATNDPYYFIDPMTGALTAVQRDDPRLTTGPEGNLGINMVRGYENTEGQGPLYSFVTPTNYVPPGSDTSGATSVPTFANPGNFGHLTPVDLLLGASELNGRYYRGDNNQYVFRPNDALDTSPIGNPVDYSDILAKAKLGAEEVGAQAATNRGLDPNAYKTLFDQEIDRILGSTPQFGTDFRNPFGTDFGNSVLDKEQNRLRSTYTNEAANTFTPNYGKQQFGDTFDDSVINDILNSQFGNAKTVLNNAHARGNLNDIGYNAGLGELGSQRAKANSMLQTAGNSVLDSYRQALDAIGQQANSQASGYTLGQNFDLGNFVNQAQQAKNNLSQSLRGDVLNAAPSDLFDTSTIIGRGGMAQGAQNEGRGLFDVLSKRNNTQTNRGLGTTGAF